MGTASFAVPSLEILIANHHPVIAVVTGVDKPRGRGREVSPTPVKIAAQRHKLPIHQPANLADGAFVGTLRELAPDLMVVVAFRILPRDVFTIPTLGAFNLHASLLPKYRGAAPINWAIINGESETGVTTFLLEEKVDTGGILLQARLPILPEDTAGSLHDRLADVGAELVLHTVRLIEQGKATPRKQDDALATPAPKIFKDDCRIRWDRPALQVHNFVRGLSPLPCAHSFHKDRLIKVHRTRITGEAVRNAPPGTVISVHPAVTVATSAGAIEVLELQQEGRKRMHADEFLRGYTIKQGDIFL